MRRKLQDYFVRNRVSFGFFWGSVALIFMHSGSRNFIVIGLFVSFLGLMIRFWAAGCIKKSKTLCQAGPYAFVRHPLYLGSFLMSVGLIVTFTDVHSPWVPGLLWGVYGLYFWSFYTAAVTSEEKLLAERFTAEWDVYKTNVPAFFPHRFSQFKNLSIKTFSLHQYLKNKEYNALIGWIAIVISIFLKNGNFKLAP